MVWSSGDSLSPTNLNRGGGTPEVFNVQSYGATGDGATDDAAAIQSTIDAAEVNGGVVYFPSGQSEVYSIGTTLNVRSALPVHLKGELAITHHNTYAGPYLEPQAQLTNGMIKYQTPSGVGRSSSGGGSIQGLAFADSLDRSWSLGEGVLNLVDFDGSRVENCVFMHLDGSAISADRMVKATIKNCHIEYCGNSTSPGIRLGTDSGDGTNVVQSTIVRDCRLEVNAGTYIYIEDQQASNQIVNCNFESDSATGSEHTYIWSKGDKIKVLDCNFNRNKKVHVHFDSASGGQNVLADCNFASAAVEPRVIVDCQRTLVSNLLAHGSEATQTEISITGDNNKLSNVLLSRCGNVEITGQQCTVDDLLIFDTDTSEKTALVLGNAGVANNVYVNTTDAGVSAFSLVGSAKLLNSSTRNIGAASDGAVLVTNLGVNSADTILFEGPQIRITNLTPLSVLTAGDANDLDAGDVRVFHQASGLSLVYSSGITLYDLGSGTSEAQPTS